MKHSKAHEMEQPMPMSWNRLLLMGAIHFVLMFILMYAMVDRIENAVPNLNQAYMAAIMTSPMLILEVWLMGGMYENKRALWAILAGSVLVFAAAFTFIRQQTGIGDKEFLRAMISHHASAILMCEQATITDPEIEELCANIESSQQEQIDFMKAKLEQID
jgi:uncharacterized protein (DUF305 family)